MTRFLNIKFTHVAKAVGVFVAVTLAACSSVHQKLDPKLFYKRDIKIEVNGRGYEGVVTIPKSREYRIKMSPKGEMDLVLIRSCAREDSAEKQGGESGFFIWSSRKTFEYLYRPNRGLEDEGVCPLRVDVYESEKGRHSWALLDFEHPDYKLEFQTDCNGRREHHNGVAVCQARKGLIQRLHFPEPVRFSAPLPENCPKPKRKGIYFYEFPLELGECLYHFDTKSGKMGRLTTVGYEGILIRGAQ